MKNFYTLLLICTTLNISAQNNIGCFNLGGPALEIAKAMVVTYDGNYVMGGITFSYNEGPFAQNFYILKTDPTGNILWTHSFGTGFLQVCYDLLETTSHDIVAVGTKDGDDILAVKYDENGNEIWSKTINIVDAATALAVVETEDNGVLITGDYQVAGALKGYLIKLDEDGNKVWEKTILNSANLFGNVALPYAVARTAENNFIVGFYSPAVINLYGIAAYDSEGNYLWAKQSVNAGVPYGIVATPDSGFVLAGTTYYAEFGDAQLCKFDKEGNPEWSKVYGDSLSDIFYSVDITSDGGFIAAGESLNYEFPPNNRQYGYIVKTNTEGEMQWSKILGDPVLRRKKFAEAHEVVDGGFVAGGTSSFEASDFFIAKFDAAGNICNDCFPGEYGESFPGTDYISIDFAAEIESALVNDLVIDQYIGGVSGSICLENVISIHNESGILNIYPNPCDNIIFIDLPPAQNNLSVNILNMNGEKISAIKGANQSRIQIITNNYPEGIYLIELINGEYILYSKIIIAH